MALVSTGFRLSVSLVDTSGSISTLRYELTAADNIAALADATTIITALEAVTDSVVGAYNVAEVFEEDALTFPASAENAIKASISLYLDEPGQQRTNVKIPAPSIGIFTGTTGPAYNTVDGADTELNDYLAIWVTTGGQATLSDGQTIRDTDYFAGGKRISRASQNP